MFNKKKSQKGQSLVEAVVALGALLLTIAAISVAIVVAVNNAQFLYGQNLGNKYAQQEMEYIRNIETNNIPITINGIPNKSFTNLSGDYCVDGNNVITPSTGTCTTVNVAGLFIRNLRVDQIGSANQCLTSNGIAGAHVVVTVKWSSSSCRNSTDQFCHSTVLESCFTGIAGTVSP